MAKVKIKVDFSEIQGKIEAVKNEVQARPTMQRLANEAARLIRVRTRLGFGVKKEGAKRKKLKTLSERYREARRRSKKLSNKTSPSKSNLTFTAQLLASLKGLVTGKGAFTVTPVGERKDSDLSNEEVAEFVAEQGREFLNFSANEIKQLEQFSEKIITQKLNKKLTK